LLRWVKQPCCFGCVAPKVSTLEAIGVLVLAMGLAIGLAVYPHFLDTFSNFQIPVIEMP
jgi:hypothetical protein